MSCSSDEQLAARALGEPDGPSGEHLASCRSCADRLAEIVARLERLEAALVVPSPEDEEGRVRLLAALEREPVPRPLIWRVVMNRRSWALTASAALIALVVVLGWPAGPSTIALAEALRLFRDEKSFACDMVTLKEGKPWDASLSADRRGKSRTRITWAAPGSLLLEVSHAGKTSSRLVLPQGRAGAMINHLDRTYTPFERQAGGKEDALLRLVETLARYSPGEKKPAAVEEVEGVMAPRYELVTPGSEGRNWHCRIWIHPRANRPVRVEFGVPPGKELTAEGVSVIRMERFTWDVKTEGLFDARPPADYKQVTVKAAEALDMTTRKIVASLKAYEKAAGGYPKRETFDSLKAVAEMEKSMGKKVDAETLEGLMLVGVLQAVSKDAVYHGKRVGPGDTGKVLLRWKLEDGSYRVIFGGLMVETVSGEKLNELEKE